MDRRQSFSAEMPATTACLAAKPVTKGPVPSASSPQRAMPATTAWLVAKLGVAALLICLPRTDAHASRLNHHILGGHEARRGQFPWQVLLHNVDLRDDTVFLCGGCVISERWVLTAGHCVRGGDNASMLLKFGGLRGDSWDELEPDSVVRRSHTFVVHEGFWTGIEPNESGMLAENDIALVRLETPLRFSDSLRPVRLPRRHQNAIEAFDGEEMTISGWGNTEFSETSDAELESSATLQYVNLTVKSPRNCVDNHFLCTKGDTAKSALQGDSGGPLVWKDGDGEFTLMGVASQLGGGYTDEATQSGPFVFVDSFTFVPFYLDWIGAHTGIAIKD